MTKSPLVSIILPNYNHAPYLEQRWQSVIQQSCQDFEIILLDDCSTDNSPVILKTYAVHPKVAHFVCNKQNSGSPFRQWKRGLELCRGKYVWIAETDDLASPNLLETLLRCDEHKAIVAFCNSHIVDKDGNLLENHYCPLVNTPSLLNGDEFICATMQSGNSIPNASAAIFSKAHAMKIKIPEDMRYCGDWVFWIRLLMLGSVYYVPEQLNYFRSHSSSTRPEDDGSRKSFVRTIEHPTYMIEYLQGAIEAYRALGSKWNPHSIDEILSQTRVIDAKHPNAKLMSSIPRDMLKKYQLNSLKRKLSIRKFLKMAASIVSRRMVPLTRKSK